MYVYDHSAVGYVIRARCIVLLYSLGTKITTTIITATTTTTTTTTTTAAATITILLIKGAYDDYLIFIVITKFAFSTVSLLVHVYHIFCRTKITKLLFVVVYLWTEYWYSGGVSI